MQIIRVRGVRASSVRASITAGSWSISTTLRTTPSRCSRPSTARCGTGCSSLDITTSSPGSQDNPAIAAAYPSAVLMVRAISSVSAPRKAASFPRATSADWHIRECHSIGGTCSS